MERWQFIESPNGAWYWLCSDVISHRTRTSASTFSTRHDCEADALGSGYRATGSGTVTAHAPSRQAAGKRRYNNTRQRPGRYT
jgi:hypothetical protein